MKYFPLLWANLKRKKVRTAFTLLSILVAFVLFGYLAAIRAAFGMGVDLAGADRLYTRHKTTITMPLPLSYRDQIARVTGVELVTHTSWFGGIYKDNSEKFQNVFQAPVEPEAYFKMYPEFLLPEAQMRAWLADREGAVIGRRTAERYGWSIGQRIPIQATIYRKKDGSAAWEFNIVGIYDGTKDGTDTTQFLFRYDYFDEARQWGQGIVGWYLVKVADPAAAARIAARIDSLFANSPNETKTETEEALAQGFADQVGNVGAMITAILTAVFFTMLLVTGNTMAQAVRERTAELAVLKTLGYTGRHVVGLVVGESLLLAVLGGGLGLGAAAFFISLGDPTGGFLPIFYFPGFDAALGAALVVLLGLATGAVPALQATRLRIVDALRRA